LAYLHFSSLEHKIGTVLKLGHWSAKVDSSRYWEVVLGRQSSIEAFREPRRLANEAMLEITRSIEFVSKPSRFSCVFVFAGILAGKLCPSCLGSNQHLYEVELVNPAANTFAANFSLLRSARRFSQGIPFFPNTREISCRYWHALDSIVPEILNESDVIIRKRVE